MFFVVLLKINHQFSVSIFVMSPIRFKDSAMSNHFLENS